jgi:hypothetical protein
MARNQIRGQIMNDISCFEWGIFTVTDIANQWVRLLTYSIDIKSAERGLSAQLRGYSEISCNPQFLQHGGTFPFLRTHSLSSNNNFSPIHRNWGNLKKFAQQVNFSEKRKILVDRPEMVAGKHEMITRRTERIFQPTVTNYMK